MLALEWGIQRNPNWNLQIQFKPKQGEKYDINEITNEGDTSIWDWRDYNNFGKQFVTWKTDGTKYFRYSYTRPFKTISLGNVLRLLIGRMFDYKYANFMAGAEHRFILKYRWLKQGKSKKNIKK